ncbi:glycosyltransferase family 2 protein [Anaerocolumna xylanovorans]|uniref:Glycosyl transferase family 2 n=1 Tax=Anaerocolumna xylanovorans DSM 12503 TaxID=1121345 RepID=A0A1M7Y4U9_9FIRM|nr:glycosyltransferase family 2 protein [Anaerocolumna xylanovorans]SHO47379.1 Glycosyl transferase family 2 [Anaerocolumna xylanovorans DSM 12503]
MYDRYALFNKKSLHNLLEFLDGRFASNADFVKLETWIGLLDLIVEFDSSFQLENHDSVSLAENLNSKEDAEQFVEECFSLKIPTVSAAIIVKDEERCIKRCLDSIRPIFDEIVVVDTGSTDKTIAILESIQDSKVKIYKIKWEDDFAKARNFALDKVTSEWVFFIDADEYFASWGESSLKSLLALLNEFPDINSTVLCPKIQDASKDCAIEVKRIFKKDTKIQYFGMIHEEARMWENDSWKTTNYISLDIALSHDGYQKNVYDQKNKAQRNLALNAQMLKQEPDNLRWVYFYVRDGKDTLPADDLKKLIESAVLIEPGRGIEEENLLLSEWTFAFMNIWAQIALRDLEEDTLMKVTKCLEVLDPGNSNAVYYKSFMELLSIKQKTWELLVELMNYRKDHFEPQYGMLHSEGCHIDFLIGTLLFENGKYNKAFSYFKFIKDQFMPQECRNHYKDLVAICKNIETDEL